MLHRFALVGPDGDGLGLDSVFYAPGEEVTWLNNSFLFSLGGWPKASSCPAVFKGFKGLR